jgi:beta-lactamase class C
MVGVTGEANRLQPLHALAARIVGKPESPLHVPGVSILVARGGEVVGRVVYGADANGVPLREDTIFPLASASKLAWGIAVLRLVEQGRLALDDPLARHLPEAGAARAGVTLRALLSHTSGLPLEFGPGQVTYGPGLDWPAMAEACLATTLAHEPGTRVQYSNIAYGLLGLVVERATGMDVRTAIERLVIDPIGAEAYVGRPGPRPHATVMDIDSPFVGTDLEPFNSAFHQHLVQPWASVYATADGLLALLQVYAGRRPDLLRPESVAAARADQTHGLGGGFATADPFVGFNRSKSIAWPHCAWGLAVELRGDKRPHWTPGAASPESFGQVGSSGCIAWHDPARDVSWVMLGPRTTDNGWILRYGGLVGTAALTLAADAA